MNRTKLYRSKIIVIVAAFAAAAIFTFRDHSSYAQKETKTAGEQFKNIKVLTDVPADEIGPLMNIMAASLRVNCSFCHTSGDGDFEKDGNEHKEITREMIRMTWSINRQFFDGKQVVSCNTCHNGQPMPAAMPNLPAQPRPPRAKPLPVKYTVDEVIERYQRALGVRAKIGAIRTRKIDAVRIEPDGKTTEPETVYQTPGRIRVETLYGNYLVVEGYDGRSAWKTGNGSPIVLKTFEAEQIAREAQLFANPDLKSVYTELKLERVEILNGRNVVFVTARPMSGGTERLYFDEQDGYLIRRIAAIPTALGDFEFQVDHNSFKSFGGVSLPQLTRFSLPNISWTRKINAVRSNVEIDEQIFKP